jgi:hypothetical protein
VRVAGADGPSVVWMVPFAFAFAAFNAGAPIRHDDETG